MLIAQISDCHIVESGGSLADRIDPALALEAAVTSINALERQPDLVLATGDLVNDGSAEQYDRLAALLHRLDAPLLPLMGNHDVRDQFRRVFTAAPAGSADTPIDQTVELEGVRIIALDTSTPGEHGGRLTSTQLAWLDRELTTQPDTPTLIAQHHPPFATGIDWMDETCGFEGADAEVDIVRRHRHVELITCGHLHRPMHRRLGGTIAMTCPSTAVTLHLDLSAGASRYSTEPPGYLMHEWRPDRGVVSHVVTIGTHATWIPTWAGD